MPPKISKQGFWKAGVLGAGALGSWQRRESGKVTEASGPGWFRVLSVGWRHLFHT